MRSYGGSWEGSAREGVRPGEVDALARRVRQLESGDVEIGGPGVRRFILISPDGTRWAVSMSDMGVMTWEPVL